MNRTRRFLRCGVRASSHVGFRGRRREPHAHHGPLAQRASSARRQHGAVRRLDPASLWSGHGLRPHSAYAGLPASLLHHRPHGGGGSGRPRGPQGGRRAPYLDPGAASPHSRGFSLPGRDQAHSSGGRGRDGHRSLRARRDRVPRLRPERARGQRRASVFRRK